MPLEHYKCKLCGAEAPKETLKHGAMEQRISWLRKHYKKNHPTAFRRMYK